MQEYIVTVNGIIRYPTSSGITGKVFRNGETIFENDFHYGKNFAFQNDIDNTESI